MSEIIKLKSNQLSTTEHFYKKLTAIEFICKEALKISELKNPVISQKQLNYEIVDREYTLINLKISNIISYAYLNEKEVYERINNAFQNFLIVALYVNAKDNTATRAGKKISNTLNEFYKIIETFDAIKNKSTIVLEQIEYIKSLFKTVDGEIDSLSFIDGALVTSNSDQKIRFKRILLLQRQIFAADFIEHLNGLNKKDAIDSKEFIRLKTLLEYEMYYLSNAINTQTNNSLEKSNPKIVLKANENLNLLQKLKEQKSKIQNEINNATSYFYDDETRKNTFNEYRENLKNNEKWKFGIGLITLYGRNNPIAKDFAIELEKHIESEKCALIQKKLKERSDISLIEKEYEKHNFWTDKKQNFTDKKIEYTYSAVNAFMAANTAKTIIQLRGKGDTDNFWGEISLSALQIASSTLATMALGPLGGTLVDGVFKGLLYQDPEPDPFKKNVTKALNEINNGVKDLNDKITILQNELPATVKSATLSALKEKEFLDCISNVTTDINTLNSLYNRLIDPKISSDISYEKIIIIENDMVGNLNKILTLFLGDQLELKIGPGNIIEVKENKDANIENSVSFKLLESANREEIKKPTKFKKRIQEEYLILNNYINIIQELIDLVSTNYEKCYIVLAGIAGVTGFHENIKVYGIDKKLEECIEDGIPLKNSLIEALFAIKCQLPILAMGEPLLLFSNQMFNSARVHEGLFLKDANKQYKNIYSFFGHWSNYYTNDISNAPIMQTRLQLTKSNVFYNYDNKFVAYELDKSPNNSLQNLYHKASLSSEKLVITEDKIHLSSFAYFELEQDDQNVYLHYKLADFSKNEIYKTVNFIKIKKTINNTYKLYITAFLDAKAEKKQFEIGITELDNLQKPLKNESIVITINDLGEEKTKLSKKSETYFTVYTLMDLVNNTTYNIDSLSGYLYEPYIESDTFKPDQIFFKGQKIITSKNSEYYLIFQEDGNLVAYDKSEKDFWSSATYSEKKKGDFVIMADKGNLEIYNKKGEVIWDFKTNTTNAYLSILNDKNLTIYDNNSFEWSLKSTNKIYSNRKIYPGFFIEEKFSLRTLRGDINYTAQLHFQKDGNLVLYLDHDGGTFFNGEHNRPLWATNTNGKGKYAIIKDRFLEVYDKHDVKIYSNGDKDKEGHYLELVKLGSFSGSNHELILRLMDKDGNFIKDFHKWTP